MAGPISDRMVLWDGASFAFNSILDEYDLRVSAILAAFDPLCVVMFKRVVRRARKRGEAQIKRKLWKQSKTRRSGYVSSRNAHGKISRAEKRRTKAAFKRSAAQQRRFEHKKSGLGAHKRGPRASYTSGKVIGHHRLVVTSGRPRYLY